MAFVSSGSTVRETKRSVEQCQHQRTNIDSQQFQKRQTFRQPEYLIFPYGDQGNVFGEQIQRETYRFDEKSSFFSVTEQQNKALLLFLAMIRYSLGAARHR